jgi:hypothetical protein
LGSIASSAPSAALKTAARAAVEGGLVGALCAAAGGALGAPVRELSAGFGLAWSLSAGSVAWLLTAKEVSSKAFWWAFGGGMALRGGGLLALMAWSWQREGVSVETLLISYAFGVLTMLLTMEMRHLKIR